MKSIFFKTNMKKVTTKIGSLLLALLMVAIAVPLTINADTAYGSCNGNIYWALDDYGTLTIYGNGAMPDYSGSYVPWKRYENSIKRVIVSEGITSIGEAFAGCSNMENIALLGNITCIDDYAFFGCTSLESITLPEGVTSIGWLAFYECSSLVSVTLPAGLKTIGRGAFCSCPNLKNVYYDGSAEGKSAITIEADNDKLTSLTWKKLSALQYGMTGTDVKEMQNYLAARGYLSVLPDGDFGNMSKMAIKKFQLRNGLSITGVADVNTLKKLYSAGALSFRTMEVGMEGEDVLAVQNYLKDLGYLSATPDGIYGGYTKAAVTAFQAANGLEGVDGMCGNWTLGVLLEGDAKSFYELKKGDYGTAVLVMQRYLVYLGYLGVEPDGDFGNMSEMAIKKFQLRNGLTVTGAADRDTLCKLYHESALPFRTMEVGMEGEDVLAVQNYLKDLGYLSATPDGIYGGYTMAAVTAFQAANGLEGVDGMCGNWTLGVLLGGNAKSLYKLQKGDYGTAVLVMQRYLAYLGYLGVEPDGDFGNMSDAALKKFQLINGLEVTGVADKETLCKLYHTSAIGQRTMMVGSYGDDVLAVQKAFRQLGYLPEYITPDGEYGGYTESAARNFQLEHGLSSADADGMVGNWTLGELIKVIVAGSEDSGEEMADFSELEAGDYCEFGSYPQTEIVSQASDCGTYGLSFGDSSDYIIDASLYNTLKNLSEDKWDENGDTTLDNGEKYRRIKQSNATLTTVGEDDKYNYGCYSWADTTTYHYFKYEPISWIVLETNDNDVLLLSELALDCQRYNLKITGTLAWENSTVRGWLNGYKVSTEKYEADYSDNNFIDAAFTFTEQSQIKTSTIENINNISEVVAQGNDTDDKIFLLSNDEVCDYIFASGIDTKDANRQAEGSTYAKAMGLGIDCDNNLGYCNWWLRTAGSHAGLFPHVRVNGSVWTGGVHADSKSLGIGVRPALRVTIETN